MFSALVIDKTGDQKARCVKQAGGLQADSLSQICGGKAEPAAVDNTEKQDQQSGLKNAVFSSSVIPAFPESRSGPAPPPASASAACSG